MAVPPDLAADHALLIDAVRGAGPIAMDHFHGANESWEKRPGDPVSDADLAVDRHIEDALRGARPGYGWLSEEGRDHASRADAERLWVVDPIDGTRAFLRGRREFSITAALIAAGRPIAGVVYNPATEELYDAVAGGGARLNGRTVRCTDAAIAGARILVSRSETQKRHWKEVFADCEVVPISSMALKLARVAAGQADATISLWPKSDWDIAAGDLLVHEAGGVARGKDGAPIVYNRARPRHEGIVAAGPALVPSLLERIATL